MGEKEVRAAGNMMEPRNKLKELKELEELKEPSEVPSVLSVPTS
jgi:hypothetical protein